MTEFETSVPVGVPATINAPCGAYAVWDRDSGCGYRCTECFATIGSVGMPRQCAEKEDRK